jgi:hypothetical protein
MIVTVAIAPNQVKNTVSYQAKPKEKPVIGPAMNFRAVANITAK